MINLDYLPYGSIRARRGITNLAFGLFQNVEEAKPLARRRSGTKIGPAPKAAE